MITAIFLLSMFPPVLNCAVVDSRGEQVATLLEQVDSQWLASAGVHEVAVMATQTRFLIATGVATLTAKLPRSTADRILATRARLDAIRRAIEHQRGGIAGDIVIEGNSRGILLLNQQPASDDAATMYVTIAVEPEVLDGFAVKPVPPSTQPALAQGPATTQPVTTTTTLAQAVGVIAGTLKDAVTTTTDSLLREAAQVLQQENIALARDMIERASRIGARPTAIDNLRTEIRLREALKRNTASVEAFLSLVKWANGNDRLAAVAVPLEESARAIVEKAGAEAFVEDAVVFYWLGRACQGAARNDSAMRAYAAAVRYGVGREFHEDAQERLSALRRKASENEESH